MNAEEMKDEQKEPILLWEYLVHDLAKCLTCSSRTMKVKAFGHIEEGQIEAVIDDITVGCADCAAAWTLRLDLGRRT